MNLLESHQNSIIKHLVKLGESSNYRKESGSILIESKKIILEALKQGLVQHVFLKEGLEIDTFEPTTFISESIAKKITSLKTSDGYFAQIKYPKYIEPKAHQKILILDQVQDPGNLGTLIRSAHAFGFEAIILIKGSCDPYNPKVIRSSMGSSINLPVYFFDYETLKLFLKENHYHVMVADMKGKEVTKIKAPVALILGNESKGSSLKDELGYHLVSIPIKNIDSLNVAIAGSILMSQISWKL